MKKLFVFVAVVIFALSFAVTGVAQQKKGEAASAGKKPSVYKEKVVTGTATVEAIDYAKRTVTLKGPEGNTVTLKVDKSAKDFKNVKKGDQVVARFTEAVAISVQKP